MPRLSTKHYLNFHKVLRRIWLNAPEAYSYLSPAQQWQLHDFFRPDEDLTKEELLAYRKTITAERASLPHQAGRAIRRLNDLMQARSKALMPVVATK